MGDINTGGHVVGDTVVCDGPGVDFVGALNRCDGAWILLLEGSDVCHGGSEIDGAVAHHESVELNTGSRDRVVRGDCRRILIVSRRYVTNGADAEIVECREDVLRLAIVRRTGIAKVGIDPKALHKFGGCLGGGSRSHRLAGAG